MLELLGTLFEALPAFILILTRLSGLMLTAPPFGSANVPVVVRFGLALAVTLPLQGLVAAEVVLPPGLPALVLPLAQEFLIGLAIGFVGMMAFAAVQVAGEVVDYEMGLGVAQALDPISGHTSSLVGRFKYLFSLVVFLSISGHHIFLAALYDSFRLLPLGAPIAAVPAALAVVELMSAVLVTAIRIAMPVIAATFLTSIALAATARVMPQMNVFIVGMPAKMFVGFAALVVALPLYLLGLEQLFALMEQQIYTVLGLMQQGGSR